MVYQARWIAYIKDRISRNKNFLSIITGPTGCLSHDTILYGHKKTLGELYKSGNRFVNTYSLRKNTKGMGYYPKKSKSEILPSGKKEDYEIEFEDGKKVLATQDHKFFVRGQHKIKEEILANLKVGDSLWSYDTKRIEAYYNHAKENHKKYG